MDFAPPPSPGSRIQELGDDLIVHFRTRPSCASVIFAVIWVTVFSVGVIPEYRDTLTGNEWWELPFAVAGCLLMLVIGLALPIVWIAWPFAGQITLTVSQNRIDVRKRLGRLSRSKRYEPTTVRDVRVAPVLTGEDNDIPRGDFRLELVRDGQKSLSVGEGMGEREAEWVAATVRSRIDPRRDWDAPEGDAPAPPARAARRAWRAAIFPAIVVALLIYLGISALTDEGRPEAAKDFADARSYAEEATRSSLSLAHMRPIGKVDCGARVGWRDWSCQAPVEGTAGAFARRRFIAGCRATRAELPDGTRGDAVQCGPIGGF